MATNTARLNLRKAGDSDLVNVTTDLDNNWDALDKAITGDFPTRQVIGNTAVGGIGGLIGGSRLAVVDNTASDSPLKLISGSGSSSDGNYQLKLRHAGYVAGDAIIGQLSDGRISFALTLGAGPSERMAIAPDGTVSAVGGVRAGGDPIGVAGSTTLSNSFGVGNAAAANLQAPAVGTGSGPVSLTAVQFIKVRLGTAVHWVPAFQ